MKDRREKDLNGITREGNSSGRDEGEKRESERERGREGGAAVNLYRFVGVYWRAGRSRCPAPSRRGINFITPPIMGKS